MSYFKWNVKCKRVGMDGVFLGLAGLLLRISLGLRPWSSPARPRITPSIPPLTQSNSLDTIKSCFKTSEGTVIKTKIKAKKND